MINTLLLLLAIVSFDFSSTSWQTLQENMAKNKANSELLSIHPQLQEINDLLHSQTPHLREAVINKVLTTLECAMLYHEEHNPVLTVIDYSLPSNEKRLWVFDLSTKKSLFPCDRPLYC